jgi:hypothetical protein
MYYSKAFVRGSISRGWGSWGIMFYEICMFSVCIFPVECVTFKAVIEYESCTFEFSILLCRVITLICLNIPIAPQCLLVLIFLFPFY